MMTADEVLLGGWSSLSVVLAFPIEERKRLGCGEMASRNGLNGMVHLFPPLGMTGVDVTSRPPPLSAPLTGTT